jgi:hypothetical protein
MGFKTLFFVGSAVVFLVIVGCTFYFLREEAAANQAATQTFELESKCAEQIPEGIRMVAREGGDPNAQNHIAGSTSHYNRTIHTCFVELNTFDVNTVADVKILLNPADKTTVLWSATKRADPTNRQCLGPDSKPLDCAQADKRWKTFMTE